MIKKNLQLKFLKDLQDFLFRNSLFNDILQITLIWVKSWVSHPRELTSNLPGSNIVWFKSYKKIFLVEVQNNKMSAHK